LADRSEGGVAISHINTLALTMVGLAICGCGHFGDSAGSFADSQAHVIAATRHAATMAYETCRISATYVYLGQRLGIEPTRLPKLAASWPSFYEHEQTKDFAGQTVTWREYCEGLDKTGGAFDAALLVMRAYGDAIVALARAKAFDASNLQTAATGASGLATALGATSSLASSISGAGPVLSQLASLVAGFVRSGKLKSSVHSAGPAIEALLRNMIAYVDGLDAEVSLAAHRLHNVVAATESPQIGPGGPVIDVAVVARDDDARLNALHLAVAQDKEALDGLRRAHAALAAAAKQPDLDKDAQIAVEKLAKALQELQATREWRE